MHINQTSIKKKQHTHTHKISFHFFPGLHYFWWGISKITITVFLYVVVLPPPPLCFQVTFDFLLNLSDLQVLHFSHFGGNYFTMFILKCSALFSCASLPDTVIICQFYFAQQLLTILSIFLSNTISVCYVDNFYQSVIKVSDSILTSNLLWSTGKNFASVILI